jgi:hypothetical protein
MKLPSYREILAMSKEAIDATLAPIRAAKARAQANLEMVKLDEQIAVLESEINETCCEREVNFARIIEKQDRLAILERRKKQYQRILDEMFPVDG